MSRKPVEFADVPLTIQQRCPFGPYRGVLKSVGDGDTADFFIDLGLYDYAYVTIRLKDFWSPDKTLIDDLMRARLVQLCPVDSHVAIVTEVGPRSGKEVKSHERFVATVYLPDGRCLNDELEIYYRELTRED